MDLDYTPAFFLLCLTVVVVVAITAAVILRDDHASALCWIEKRIILHLQGEIICGDEGQRDIVRRNKL